MDSKIALTAASLPIIEAGMAFTHQGAIGMVIGLGATAMVYVGLDELSKRGRDISLPQPSLPRSRERQPGEMGAWYRMTHGKDARGEAGDDHEDSGVAPQMFVMDDVLDVIREFNRQGYIYFGASFNGAVAIHLHDLIHVLDVTVSGNGKSNRLRLIMPQIAKMAQCYYINPLANKIKPVKDIRQYEIWTPVYDLLAHPPVKTGEEIESLLKAFALEINRRNQQEEQNDFSWQQDTVVLFVDELPEVFARCPQAAEYIDTIGRMGRQYNMIMYLCSQTAQVKDIGLSGAAQANFKTKIYGGGDATSANRTMKGTVSKENERILQSEKGLTLMLANGVHGDFVRAPLVTNTGLFAYLDLPPFRLEDWVSTSRTPSRASGVSPSIAPSNGLKNPPTNQTVKEALKGWNEGAGRGLEGAEGDEGAMEGEETEELQLSEREELIIKMFLGGAGIGEIASKLADGATGGSRYQKTSKEVQDTIREYMEKKRG